MNPWQTTQGPKQECREAFLRGIREHIEAPTDFFVLPSEDAHDVYMIKHKWPRSRVRGVERDRTVCQTIDRNHIDVDTWPMTVSDYVRREQNDPSMLFDAAFLDFVGWMNPQNLRDAVAFARHLAKPRFVLALTFQKNARGQKDIVRQAVLKQSCLDDDDLKAVEDNDTSEWNQPHYVADAVCGAIERAMPGLISRLDILDAREYRAQETSTDMFFMTLLVERY